MVTFGADARFHENGTFVSREIMHFYGLSRHVNEQTNKLTSQQTQPITITPGG